MNGVGVRRLSASQISIRSYGFASDDSSIYYSRSNGDAAREYRARLCEPCTFLIDVLVPYESSSPTPLTPRLDVYDNRGIETQIWTNVCDKFSSTGRWHAIPAQRIDIHRELRGRIHSFAVSVIPIRCGVFEFTARARAPKSGNSDWVWGSAYDKNETLHVVRTGSQRTGLTQGSVRQLAQWFDDVLTYWLVEDTEPAANRRRSVLAAYTAVFLAVIALQEGEDVGVRRQGET